jgi:adenylate kinase family enzyme
MDRVAVFGNTGGGKSTLSRRLAEITHLPLYVLDVIQFDGRYRPNEKDGGKVPEDQYLKIHRNIWPGTDGSSMVTAACRQRGSGSLQRTP